MLSALIVQLLSGTKLVSKESMCKYRLDNVVGNSVIKLCCYFYHYRHCKCVVSGFKHN